MQTTQQNLTEALAVVGITHRPSKIEGRRDWFNAAGDFIGDYDAVEGWEALKRSFQAASVTR